MKTYLILTAFVLFWMSSATASVYTAGHGDIGLGESDELELHLHLHEEAIVDGSALIEDTEYEPCEITIAVPNTTATARPADSAWDFIGNAAGADFRALPESHAVAESQGTPFLGIGAEEIDTGIFENDDITLTLTGLSGPGQFSLYRLELGSPVVFMASSDGITSADSIVLNLATGHEHFNFAFSASGLYDITFEVSAIDAATQTAVTDEATFSFHVIPEPATVCLLAVGILALRKPQ
jgi:surface-anchored protein